MRDGEHRFPFGSHASRTEVLMPIVRMILPVPGEDAAIGDIERFAASPDGLALLGAGR